MNNPNRPILIVVHQPDDDRMPDILGAIHDRLNILPEQIGWTRDDTQLSAALEKHGKEIRVICALEISGVVGLIADKILIALDDKELGTKLAEALSDIAKKPSVTA